MSTDDQSIERHVVITSAEQRAVAVLHEASQLPAQRVKHAMQQGAVWITRGRKTQRLRRATRQLKPGDELHLYYHPAILSEVPTAPDLIDDQNDYSVWLKPRGLRSQGSKWGDHCTVVRHAERTLRPERSAFTVHRLDRAATGLILIAHSKRTAAALSAMFRRRLMEKRYRAVVEGELHGNGEMQVVSSSLDSKPARSEYLALAYDGVSNRSVVDVRIETGRKHQIRRHLASVGHPIVGDRLHGFADAQSPDLQLCAYQLKFECPTRGVEVNYSIEPNELLIAKA